MFSFTITHQETNCNARTGIIQTSHGSLKTPAFIPVATQATIKALSSEQLGEIGFEAALCNTYHLYLQPGENIVEKCGGLHGFMNFNKPLFTDSGGFQVFSLNNLFCKVDDDKVTFTSHIDNSKHIFTPEKSMQIQRKLGADMIFAFDQCLDINADYETTKKSLERTHEWELRSLKEFQKLNKDKKQALYGIVQGGRFTELREESAKYIASLPFDGMSIGSIFGDPKEESKNLVEHAIQFLPHDKPLHMLGIGSVDDLFTYVELGADTFDCVLPTRLARMGYAFIGPESGGNIQNKFRMKITKATYKEDLSPLDKNCTCSVCTNYSNAYLYHLYKAKELLFYSLMTFHNLHFFARLMEEIRQSIESDTFKELKKKWIN
ncbi:tRNA guanosine(34) transglycosylase Tgt [Candidatus Woesearchaeota archaeon]|jgi:queuine tRNA-ribosyltransferase|nr:tRNA guanosine(34) transglycosylase Tgt [Candidatus Woesearchaeota archaeon]MBT5396677.1 tRNA guanosine(34) transglycosylase Tgt [Candidatus Woesearchaeota archaeon]MBT5924378.1 tRNA guanosine(34) transglycosylase Tgt [Candidatus Woesearchaeota archaeon]MBT6367536.1 tRNA guanosine(34) transglycosylase Tgt [Candidatus Woesearchaeota archaeon]MBT7763035.1 tRNA guanosine(34) transglycosylase Tgt [Candidatus Woesearchaeota archaeon]